MRPNSDREQLESREALSNALTTSFARGAASLVCCCVLVFASCSGIKGPSSPNSNSDSETKHPADAPVTCGTSYYPVKGDQRWEYRFSYAGSKPRPAVWSQRRTSIAIGSFVDQLEFTDGSKADVRWTCTANGMLGSEFWHIALQRMSLPAGLETINREGITLPAENGWWVGSKWQSTYYVVEFGKSHSDVVGSGPEGRIQTSSEIVSQEQVSVRAGTFKCFLVRSTTSGPLGERSRALLQTMAWYAKDVGLVKLVFSGDPGTGTVELISFM